MSASSGNVELELNMQDVIDMSSDTDVDLTILGNDGDSVELTNTTNADGTENTWSQDEGTTTDDDGNEFVTFTNNDASVLIDMDVAVTMG